MKTEKTETGKGKVSILLHPFLWHDGIRFFYERYSDDSFTMLSVGAQTQLKAGDKSSSLLPTAPSMAGSHSRSLFLSSLWFESGFVGKR